MQSKDEIIQKMQQRIDSMETELQTARSLQEQLQDSQSLFREVTDNIQQVFWMTDPQKNTMLFLSKAYEQIWGRPCQSVLDNPMSWVESIHPEDRDLAITSFPQQIEGTYDIEYRIINANGDIRWIHDKAFPIKNSAGKLYRVVGFAQDITEKKKLLDDLKTEKDKSDYLLENILPKSIIEELKKAKLISNTSPAIAKKIDHATVLFADIVGFTVLSQQHSAEYIVGQLNKLFFLFDNLVDSYGLEKIKTIGDCYMLAGGVPDYQNDHAFLVANVALEMIKSLAHFNQVQNSQLNIRIGIHSGPMVAGVIGFKKYIYDIWGDTVNTASRMESHGIMGKVQVSEDTYILLKDRFVFESRGRIEIKGKGQLNTYMLISKLP